MSNLSVRIIVAVVGIPVILLLAMAGGFSFFAFVAAVSLLALREYYRLAQMKGSSPQVGLGLVFGFCVNAVFLYEKLRDLVVAGFHEYGLSVPFPSMAQLFMMQFLVFVPLILLVELFRNREHALQNVGVTVTGVAYVAVSLGTLIGIRELFVPGVFPFFSHFGLAGAGIPAELIATVSAWGGYTILAVFASIWLCDSAAYFAGTWFGRRKLFPRVSPKKTWEGAIAGLMGAVLAFTVVQSFLLPYLSLGGALICGTIIGVFGQLGDMVESLLKRDAGVKDSSTLIPGHGGILDRFDSLIFVSPLLFLYLDFVVFS